MAYLPRNSGWYRKHFTMPSDWASIDGPMLPFGFDNCTVQRSLALQEAVRTGSPDTFAQTLTT